MSYKLVFYSFISILESFNPDDEICSSIYYGNKILSIVGNKKIIACQFHPEKSGEVDLKY